MYPYSEYLQQKEIIEQLFVVILVLLGILVVIIFRNWYNLYKKRSFRKKNKLLLEELEVVQRDLSHYNKQLINKKLVEKNLSKKHTEIFELESKITAYKNTFETTLADKEKEIAEQNEVIKYQQKAYERYVNFKNVEANNTRLGAHFVKNVISQIYEDLEEIEKGYKTFLGFQYKSRHTKKKIPSIKALKYIFKLLDYNVSALNKESTTIEEELAHIHMFLELIKYLKPNAKIALNNSLNKEQNNAIKIKPTLFFPFVENALKHGSLNDSNSFISIDLKENEDKQLSYCLVNSAEHPFTTELDKNTTSKFGLHALKQLIDAYYPGSKIEHASLPNKQYMSQLTLTLQS